LLFVTQDTFLQIFNVVSELFNIVTILTTLFYKKSFTFFKKSYFLDSCENVKHSKHILQVIINFYSSKDD